jgi:hypothetical protein
MIARVGKAFVPLSAVVMVATSCVIGPPPPPEYYNCPRVYDQYWQNSPGFTLTNPLPAPCPIDGSSSTLWGGGEVTELNTTYPTWGDAWALDVDVYDYFYYSPPRVSLWIASTSELFGYVGSGGDYEWAAQDWLSFTKGLNPDVIQFSVHLTSTSDSPTAWYLLEYAGEPE